LLILGAVVAPAQVNNIVQWNEEIPTNAYTIDQEAKTIRIDIPGDYTFKFYAVDETGDPGTGIINNITVHPDATGDFSILIEHPDGYAGALDWKEGNLTYAGGVSTVTGVKVAGNLGAEDKWIYIDRLDGSIDVGGTTWVLEVDQWISPSPAHIHFGDYAMSLHVNTACAGDILADDGIARVPHPLKGGGLMRTTLDCLHARSSSAT
jgi:hypothetical protein